MKTVPSLRRSCSANRAAALILPSLLLVATPCRAQQLVPGIHGFSYGTSHGRSSFYRQESRSEASGLLQVLTTNAIPLSPEDGRFEISNPREGFAVIQVGKSESAADGQTTVGGSTFSGFSYSVFSN
jgi:hypothetical protein